MRKSPELLQRPFLDDHDGEPGLREDLGGDAAAGAAADDHDIGFQGEVAIERGGVDDLPAARDALADRIGDHAGLEPSEAARDSRSAPRTPGCRTTPRG